MITKILMVSVLICFGCGCVTTQVPRTLAEYSRTEPNGVKTALKISLEKEVTADDLDIAFKGANGESFTVKAKHLESRNANIITSDTEHLQAVGTCAGTVIKGLGGAAGTAAAIVIGSEGLNAATQGLGQLIQGKMTMDAASQAAEAAKAAGGVK